MFIGTMMKPEHKVQICKKYLKSKGFKVKLIVKYPKRRDDKFEKLYCLVDTNSYEARPKLCNSLIFIEHCSFFIFDEKGTNIKEFVPIQNLLTNVDKVLYG